ncbi:MFS transporter [Sphingobium sp. CFD-2]|uniref:MFS transporter n=1 Tax=Sphingobium sp. CFD-2 TaxID=2878542 RepID=UPI00214CD39E|nr:MFS transporter [Sphingobium sp. CFD-2]
MPDDSDDDQPLSGFAQASAEEMAASVMPSTGAFRSLHNRNFRIWAAGTTISNVGAWMQRIAQDWLILTVLTNHNAAAVGIVTALQFGPQLVLVPWTGHVADHFDRRKVLLLTQVATCLLALGLGLLTIGGVARPWHVYIFALLLGCVMAFDAPVRQIFVSDIVDDADLSNAVGLNATLVNVSRLIGPAVAGLVIAAVGPGWAFLINATSFIAVMLSLICMRKNELHRHDPPAKTGNGLAEGIRYVAQRPDLKVLLLMLMVFGTFGMNFPIFISTMAASVFRLDAGGYGLLSSVMAVGSLIGAFLTARREKPTIFVIAVGAAIFGAGYALSAAMPNAILFGIALMVVGAASQTVTTSIMGLIQLSTDRPMRGRVMAIVVTVALGGQPVGAPLVGWIANAAGPRLALLVGALTGILVAAIGFRFVRGSAPTHLSKSALADDF